MAVVTATELARDTRRILDLVSQNRVSVEVRRNDVAVARLYPVRPTMTAAEALAGLHADLTHEQAQEWLRASRTPFVDAVADPWV